MSYPRFVFKNGGPLQRAGGSYGHLLVQDETEHAAAVKAGWFETLPEAIEGKVESTVEPDDAPPTRAELEAKATELGIKFDRRLGDKRLAELIREHLEG